MLLAHLSTQPHQAIGDAADRVADSTLALFNELQECVLNFKTLLRGVVAVFDHDCVSFKAFGAVSEAFGHLVEPGDAGLVRTHEQVEHENDALETILIAEEPLDQGIEACNLCVLSPLADFLRYNQIFKGVQ